MTEAVVDDTLDDHTIVQPYRLGPTLRACDSLQIVACSSARPEARELVGSRSGISKEHQYADYQELIDRERPELVVIGTQPEQRAERAIYAAEHGVKAIYAEKAMAASMQEVDAMVDAVERNGVFFNRHPPIDRTTPISGTYSATPTRSRPATSGRRSQAITPCSSPNPPKG